MEATVAAVGSVVALHNDINGPGGGDTSSMEATFPAKSLSKMSGTVDSCGLVVNQVCLSGDRTISPAATDTKQNGPTSPVPSVTGRVIYDDTGLNQDSGTSVDNGSFERASRDHTHVDSSADTSVPCIIRPKPCYPSSQEEPAATLPASSQDVDPTLLITHYEHSPKRYASVKNKSDSADSSDLQQSENSAFNKLALPHSGVSMSSAGITATMHLHNQQSPLSSSPIDDHGDSYVGMRLASSESGVDLAMQQQRSDINMSPGGSSGVSSPHHTVSNSGPHTHLPNLGDLPTASSCHPVMPRLADGLSSGEEDVPDDDDYNHDPTTTHHRTVADSEPALEASNQPTLAAEPKNPTAELMQRQMEAIEHGLVNKLTSGARLSDSPHGALPNGDSGGGAYKPMVPTQPAPTQKLVVNTVIPAPSLLPNLPSADLLPTHYNHVMRSLQ